MESSTVTPASALSAALPPTRLDRPLFIYPLDPDWRRDMRRGVLTLGGIGFASGFAHGVWKDTWMTLTGLQNFYNVVCTSTAFFVLREFAVSPLLVQLRLTEDHRRRYLINRAASPRHHLPTDPPLPPEQWSHIRYRKLLDTGITAGITSIIGPRFYRKLLVMQGYDAALKLSPRVNLHTFLFFGTLASAIQFGWNSYVIHDLRLHTAYDAFGPMPDVDIVRVRAQEREDLSRAAMYSVVREEEEAKRTGKVEEKWEEKELKWWEWERFKRDGLPRMERVKGVDHLKEIRGRKKKMENELVMIGEELADMGEILELVLADEDGILD